MKKKEIFTIIQERLIHIFGVHTTGYTIEFIKGSKCCKYCNLCWL